jgi:hypothetical protein
MQPGRLQRGNKRVDLGPQQLHQHNAHDRNGHGHSTDDFYLVFFLGDQGKNGERPHEAEQHLVDTGKRRMSGFVPAMRHGAGVGDQPSPCRQRREANIRWDARHSKTQVERSRARIENQRSIKQVGIV